MNELPDLPRQRGKRQQLVDQLREMKITDEQVLRAMMQVPRHWFLDPAFESFAYENKAFKIGAGQTISQPYTVAFQTQLLQAEKGMKVLEIGTGSGYQTAVLSKLGLKVFSVERQQELFDKVKKFLPSIDVAAKLFFGDGYKGLEAFAPFDRILVTAGAPSIPEILVDQLKPGGIMVIPVGNSEVQHMMRIIRGPAGEIRRENHGIFRFVPMLEETERKIRH